MAQNQRSQAEILSGSPQPNFTGYSVSPIISRRDPTPNDRGYPFGQVWINRLSNGSFTLTSVAAGIANWVQSGSSGASINSITGDVGAPILPVLGNINILGSPDIEFSGAGATMSATDLVKITPYVVAASDAPYTSIQTAINAAAAAGGGTVALRSGIYVENITLSAGVNLVGFSGFSLTPSTVINGTVTASFAGSVTITNIGITENVGSPIVISGAAATTLILLNCVINCANSDVISCTNTNSFVVFYFSILNQAGAFKFFDVTGGRLNFAFSFLFGGPTVVNNTISGGQISIINSNVLGGITITGTGQLSGRGGQINARTGFAIDQQVVGTNATLTDVDITTSAALSPVINIPAGSEVYLSDCRIGGSAATVVSGAGIFTFDNIRFFQGGGTVLDPALTVQVLTTEPLPISGISLAMIAGTTTISTTAVTGASRIFLTVNTQDVANAGFISAPTASITPGVSFVINSTNAADTSTVNWWVVN